MRPRLRPSRPALRLVAPLLALSLALPSAAPSLAQPPAPVNAGELRIAMEKLLVVGNVLYVAAHPDDENTALLAYLSKGRKVRAAYLALTRGDGGQNLIGAEKGERIGVIRTQELLSARRVDGAEQFFTRAIDFGYSKTKDETLRTWQKEEVLSDVVRVFRTFRPDVVICRFPTNGDGGHGHHTASAILAGEAFAAAADPKRFPEQIAKDGLSPWQARRLFWNAWRIDPATRDPKLPRLLSVDLGAYEPLLGRSWTEIAAESRSMHKSQGFGSAERRGTSVNWLEPLAGEPAADDFLEGIDLTWGRVPGGAPVEAALKKALAAWRPESPAAALPALLEAHRAMSALPAGNPWVARKRAELLDVVRDVTGLWLEAVSAVPEGAPGTSVKVAPLALNRSGASLVVKRVEIVGGGRGEAAGPGNAAASVVPAAPGALLADNVPWKGEVAVPLPLPTPETDPYWLRLRPGLGLFRVADPALIGRADSPPALVARFTLAVSGEELVFAVPVEYRSTDPVKGERYRPFAVVPRVALHLETPVLFFPSRASRSVAVSVRAGAPSVAGTVSLAVPPGWTASPPQPVSFTKEGEESLLRFTVAPPAGASSGTLRAEAAVSGETFSHDLVRIDYPHIPVQVLTPPAEASLVRADTLVTVRTAGYVVGSGDDVPEALRQLGLDVTLLSDDDIAAGGLSRFDVIVAGVRAYNTRPRLKALHGLLVDYVRAGGTYVVQYNTSGDLAADPPGPFPMKVSRDRVTDETAKVGFVDPANPVLNVPNRIGPTDFDGWVQERGLYFPSEWSAEYVPVLSMADPGEKETKGALLVARAGKGTFVYTGLAFFRQLPAGVPGAYRLFANVLSAGRAAVPPKR